MNFEQVEKIKKYLLEQGQQELVGHLDGMIGEWRKAQAILEEQLPVVDTPLEDGQAPDPSTEITSEGEPVNDPADDGETSEDRTSAQDFQDSAAEPKES